MRAKFYRVSWLTTLIASSILWILMWTLITVSRRSCSQVYLSSCQTLSLLTSLVWTHLLLTMDKVFGCFVGSDLLTIVRFEWFLVLLDNGGRRAVPETWVWIEERSSVGPGFNLNTRSPWRGHRNVAVEFGHSKETHSDIQNMMDMVIAEVISQLMLFTRMLVLTRPNTDVLDMCKRKWKQCWGSWTRKHLDWN